MKSAKCVERYTMSRGRRQPGPLHVFLHVSAGLVWRDKVAMVVTATLHSKTVQITFLHILHDVTTRFTVDHPYSLLGDLG